MIEVTQLQPRQRTIVVCDVEGSTTRTNPTKAAIRADTYDLLEAALLECKITEDLREPFINTGDGVMTLVRPVDGVPKTLLLHTFVPALSEMLAAHANVHPDRSFRLRVAIHSGDVHFDRQGAFGEDIDLTFRLLDAPKLKQRLQQTQAPLVLAVSDHIHRSIIRHGYDGIDGRTFEPIIVLEMAGQRHVGWVQVPGEAMSSLEVPRIDRVS
jgi:class 3 adenylate cyclase